jgi:small-conductance mechanosensitive channel
MMNLAQNTSEDEKTEGEASGEENASEALEAFTEPEIIKAVDVSNWLDALSINQVHQIIFILGVVGLFYLIRMYIRKKAADKRGQFAINLFEAVNLPIQCLFLITAFMLIIRITLPAIASLAALSIVYKLALLISATWLIMRLITFASDRILRKFTREEGNFRARQRYTQIKVIRRIVMVLIIILMAATGLLMFDGIRTIGVSLLASAGVAGIILGLAAQKTIGNFLVGLQIAFTQPIRLDDVVVVEGEWGRIEEITLTYVVVRIWDKRCLVLPTSYFIDNPFQNWTRTSTDILGTVYIHVDYRTPVDAIREELDRFLDGNDLWDGNVKGVQITDTTETTVALRLLVSAHNASTVWNLRCALREHMIRFLAEKHPESLPIMRAFMEETPDDKPKPLPRKKPKASA